MDPIELGELWRAAKKLWRSGVLPESVLKQLAGSPLMQLEPKVHTLSTSSFVKGFRMVEDLVQSLLLPSYTLKMQEAGPKFYRHGAFESVM